MSNLRLQTMVWRLRTQLEKDLAIDYTNRLINKEIINFLAKLDKIVPKAISDDKAYLEQIESLLQERWAKIAGTYLSYTSQNQNFLTLICYELAKTLHQNNNNRSIYQYLMPTLIHTTDNILYLKESLEQHPLNTVILSDDTHSLIPVSILSFLSHHGNVTLTDLVNPFTGQKLSINELQRLKEFSPQAKELIETFNLIQEVKSGNSSIGSYIQKLIIALREGGEHGEHGGKENEASIEALTGIMNFLEYWWHIPEEERIELSKLKSASEEQSLGDLIAILNKSDSKSFDCVESISYVLEKILKEHGNILFKSSTSGWGFIDLLYKKFGVLSNNLRDNPIGTDPHKTIETKLLIELDWVNEVQSLDDLIELLKILKPSQLDELRKDLTPLIKEYIVTTEDLQKLLVALDPVNYPFIFANLDEAQNLFLNDLEYFAFLLEQLTSVQRDAVFTHFKSHISNLTGDKEKLVRLFRFLSEENREILFKMLGDNIKPLFSSSIVSLTIGLTYLSTEAFSIICEAVSNQLPHLIRNGSQFNNLFQELSAEKRTIFLEYFNEFLPGIIHDGKQLGNVLNYLDLKQGEDLCMQLLRLKPSVVNRGFEFCNALFPLAPEKRHLVFSIFREILPTILINLTEFTLVLKYLPSEDQNELRRDIKRIVGLEGNTELSDADLFTQFKKTIKAGASYHYNDNRNCFFKSQQDESFLLNLLKKNEETSLNRPIGFR